MSRILALDVGERRIGVAISDPDERLAVPLRILERQSAATDTKSIIDIAQAENVKLLVVGHPLSLDGTVGPQARRVEEFAARLRTASGLLLELWDERLSSVQAERQLPNTRKARPKGSRRRRAPVDDLAAAIILQSYLDRRRADSEAPSEA